jgi:hypothetical protein
VISNAAIDAETEMQQEGMRMKIQMRNVSGFSTSMLAAGLVALMAGSAGAAPIAITQAAF